MCRICHLVLLALFVGVLFFSGHTKVVAEQRELKSDAAEKVDAVLLLDRSGSMLLNDPLRLRDEGARLFIQFLKPGDRLAIVEFAEEAKVIRPLEEYDPQQGDKIANLISSVRADGEYTDILAGIKVAREILTQGDGKSREARPLIVLLSDGRMDPDPAKGMAQEFSRTLLDDLLPEMKAAGQRVYTLAFSAEADRDLLQQIAAGTDAVMWFTPSSEQVHKSYADLFLTVKKPQVVPLGDKGFTIDADVKEATFYIDRSSEEDVKIQSPDGDILTPATKRDDLRWYRGTQFDVITVTKPKAGSWHVVGISPQEGFATILTNLKLVSSWPTSIDAESEELLEARLYEDKKPVSLPEMSGVVRFAFQITPTDRVAEPILREILVDDGTKGDLIAEDGIFSFKIKIDEPGEYRLRVIARGPTFERQLQLPFHVKPPLITLKVVEGEHHGGSHGDAHAADHGHGEKHDDHAKDHSEHSHDEHQDSHAAEEHPAEEQGEDHSQGGVIEGDEHKVFQIELSDEVKMYRNIKVELSAVDSRKSLYKIPLHKAGADGMRYEAESKLLPHDGEYELIASLSAEARQKKPVRAKSKTLQFNRTSTGAIDTPVVQVVEVEEKKEEGFQFPILGVVLVTVFNLIAGAAGIFLLKKARGPSADQEVTLEPVSAEIIKALEELAKRAANAQVDFEAPEFLEDDDEEVAADSPAEPESAEVAAPPASESAESEQQEEVAAEDPQ